MTNGKTRTLAFQIDETLFQRIKAHLERESVRTGRKLTQKEFVLGLIEQALAEAEANAKPAPIPPLSAPVRPRRGRTRTRARQRTRAGIEPPQPRVAPSRPQRHRTAEAPKPARTGWSLGPLFFVFSQPWQARNPATRPPASGPGRPGSPPPWRCGYGPASRNPGTGRAWPPPPAQSGSDCTQKPFFPLSFVQFQCLRHSHRLCPASLKTVYHSGPIASTHSGIFCIIHKIEYT